MSQKSRKSDPSKTKTGKTRLGPLNVRQLEEMLEKSSRPKEKGKIVRRLSELKSRPGYRAPVAAVEETVAE
jgi:hypothetical protein